MLFLFPFDHQTMDELASFCQNLSLSKREQTDYILPLDQRIGEFILAAKDFTTRFLNMDVVAWTLKQIWRSTNGFRIRHQGDLRILFVFDNLSNVDKILHNQPWSFDKHLVVLQRYVHDIPVRSLTFNKATI